MVSGELLELLYLLAMAAVRWFWSRIIWGFLITSYHHLFARSLDPSVSLSIDCLAENESSPCLLLPRPSSFHPPLTVHKDRVIPDLSLLHQTLSLHDDHTRSITVAVTVTWPAVSDGNEVLCFDLPEITKHSTCIALLPSISQLLFTISLPPLYSQHSFVVEASLSGQGVVWAHAVDPHCRYGSCLRALAHHLLSADISKDLPLEEEYPHTVDLQAETNPEEFDFVANLMTAELDEEQMALLGQRHPSRIFYFQYPRIQKDQASIFPLNGSKVDSYQVSIENPLKNHRLPTTIRNMTELQQLLHRISATSDPHQQQEEVLNDELWKLLVKGGMELCSKYLQPIQQQWHEAGGVRSLCGGVLKEMHRTFFLQLLQVAVGLPKIQWRPQVFNKGQPFIFLHLEKTAGTTLRE